MAMLRAYDLIFFAAFAYLAAFLLARWMFAP